MAGRRRSGQFASTLTTLYAYDRERRMKQMDEERKAQREREEFDRRLDRVLQLRQQGIPAQIGSTGAISLGTAPRAQDPIVTANRIAQLKNRLQKIEEQNALAPMLAREKQLQAFPEAQLGIFKPGPGLFGGFSEHPNAVQRFFGVQARPPLGPIPTTDTSFLRSQLLNATEQGDDPIVRKGTDTATGRRVGLTRSGQVVPLD